MPGHDYTPYYGVTTSVEVWLDGNCSLQVPEFKIIEAPHALILLGADALRPGYYNENGWTYRSLGGEVGAGGFLEF